MTIFRRSTAAALLAASLAANVVAAAPDAPPPADGGHMEHGMPPPHDGGEGRLHGLHRLDLTEAQQDKLFALEHAAEPQEREWHKAIRHAHDTLRDLGRADRFDDARAAAASRDLGQAVAAQALAQARLHAQVLAVLTPEQREQMRRERPGFRHGAGPEGRAEGTAENDKAFARP